MIISGKLKKRYRQALNFYASKVFTPQLSKHVEVRVRFRDLGKHLNGHVIVEDYNVAGYPRTFIIEVNRNDPEDEILKTLAHELIHCRQYAKQELNEEMSVWRGERIDADELPYDEQPWEIEAEMTGLLLYEYFIDTERLNGGP